MSARPGVSPDSDLRKPGLITSTPHPVQELIVREKLLHSWGDFKRQKFAFDDVVRPETNQAYREMPQKCCQQSVLKSPNLRSCTTWESPSLHMVNPSSIFMTRREKIRAAGCVIDGLVAIVRMTNWRSRSHQKVGQME